jgi:hypothetical protein
MYPDVDGFREALRDGGVTLYPLPAAVAAYDDADAAGD